VPERLADVGNARRRGDVCCVDRHLRLLRPQQAPGRRL
jgi:hypothetical protein